MLSRRMDCGKVPLQGQGEAAVRYAATDTREQQSAAGLTETQPRFVNGV